MENIFIVMSTLFGTIWYLIGVKNKDNLALLHSTVWYASFAIMMYIFISNHK